jgi:DNA-binding transcriptional LysR family regulator
VVITPRGAELLAELDRLLPDVAGLVARPGPFDPAGLRRSFSIRANEVVIAAIGGQLMALVGAEAPGVELRFALEAADDLEALRSGAATLAIGSYGELTSDLDTEPVAEERMVGVLAAAHPWAGRRMTIARFAQLDHVVVSRRGRARSPLDDALAAQGRHRRVAAVVPSFAAALAMCAEPGHTALVPSRLAATFAAGAGLVVYDPPVPIPTVTVLQVWHGRFTADPAHAWLRGCVRRVRR